MPSPAFVHLRLHSEYSITDGTIRLNDAIARAAADGMPALALTDLANLFGLADTLQRLPRQSLCPFCQDNGNIKTIIKAKRDSAEKSFRLP